MTTERVINKTLEYEDLRDPQVRPTARALRRWVWGWLARGERLGVNGVARRRLYIRPHKLWEYARGLALTGAAGPARRRGSRLSILDVGGAMTAPVLYQGCLGDRVLTLDIDEALVEQTNRTARRRGLNVEARTTNLARQAVGAGDLGGGDGFDRVYCFCVIEHLPADEQPVLARRMGQMLRPGGQMCLTFDYGEPAPSETPLHEPAHVERLREAVGLPLIGNGSFVDAGRRYPLDRHRPGEVYTFGSLFFQRPP